MTFSEAVRILKSPHVPGIEGYITHATASATYYAHHISRTDHPVRDNEWRERPVLSGGGAADTPEVDPRRPRSGVLGAQEASRSGATLVQRLPGPASAYFVQALGDGSTGLYRTAEADGALDPGKVNVGNGFTGDARRRIIAADASRTQSTLRSINEANRRRWNQ